MLDAPKPARSASASALRVVTATEANRSFSAMLRRAKSGETIAITDRGKVVARLIPEADEKDEAAERRRREEAWEKTKRRLLSQKPMNLGKFDRNWAYDDE